MQKKIFLESKSGKVCCIHKRIEGSSSVVILAHGYLSDKKSRTNMELSKRLNKAGISTMAFDIYGHGESGGDVERLTITKAVENVLAVYDFAKSRGYKRIGLSGSSFSGIVSLVAATKREFSALSLKCPVFDSKRLWDRRHGKKKIEGWRKKGYLVQFGKRWRYEAYEDASGYDMRGIASGITAPTLVIHGDKDKTVPISHAKDIIKHVSGEKKLVIVKGADHFFREPAHFRKIIDASFRWLSSHLE